MRFCLLTCSFLVLVVVAEDANVGLSGCPIGWTHYKQSCLYASHTDDKRSFSDAENFCITNGAQLLVLTTGEFTDVIQQPLNTDNRYWIGLVEHISSADGRTWKWLDGNDYRGNHEIINGVLEQPSTTQAQIEECVTLQPTNTTHYELHDFPCSQKANFICQKNLEANQTEPVRWQHINDRCLYAALTRDKYTFSEAKLACLLLNSSAHLPTFNDSTDWFGFLVFKRGSVGYNKTWLGYQDRHVDGVWQTHDNKDLQFYRFETWNPSSIRHDCAITSGQRDFYWEEDLCTANYTTICQMCFDDPMKHAHEKCPTGWKYFPESSSCYYLSTERFDNWADAQDFCRQDDADLLTLESISEKEFLRLQMLVGLDYWISLTGRATFNGSRKWSWFDGSPLDTNIVAWREDQPEENSNCVVVREQIPLTAVLIAVPCYDSLVSWVICKKTVEMDEEPTAPTTSCPENWINRQGTPYCYYYSNTTKQISEAESECESKGANLLTIHSFDELGWIGGHAAQTTQTDPIWLGVKPNSHSLGRMWKWTDGELLKSEHIDLKWLGDSEYDLVNIDRCVAVRNFNEILLISCGLNYGYPFVCCQPAQFDTNNHYKIECPRKWSASDNSLSCYRIFENTNNLTWTAAHKYCVSVGGILASVQSRNEQAFLRNLTNSSSIFYMIGLYNYVHMSDRLSYFLRWSDGMMFTESDSEMIKWQPGEPSTDITSTSCVAVSRTIEPAMQHVNCSQKLPFYCKLNSDKKICNESNTVWSECQASPLCQPDCYGPKEFPTVTCMQICHSGCVCKKGYLRINPNGKCVPNIECRTPVNRHYRFSDKINSSLEERQKVCSSHVRLTLTTDTDCYRLIKASKNFAMADGYCSEFGGFLAIVNDMQMVDKLSVVLRKAHILAAFVGLRRQKFEDWNWGYNSQSKTVLTSSTFNFPWISGSPANEQSAITKNAAVLSVCESGENNCYSGLADVSQDEEFPFICQFNIGDVDSQGTVKGNSVSPSDHHTISTLTSFLIVSIICCTILLWTHLRRRERFLLMEKSIKNRLATVWRRQDPGLNVDYTSLLRRRSLTEN